MYVKSMLGKLGGPQQTRTLLFIGAIGSILWSVYFSIVTIFIPYQIEFREGTALVLTKILMGGGNPFSFENQPLAMNNYGLGYNLTVLPFALLFGNTLIVHRTVTFVFILLASLVVFLSLKKSSIEPSLALICSAFLMICLIANGGIGAFPAAMGTFLFYMAILVPYTHSFDRTGLWISIFVSLVSFYTKPYFILGFGIVASYLFFCVSKKRSIFYVVQFLFLLVISFLIARFAFPFYFINTIIGNISNTYRTLEHLMEQLIFLLLYFYPTLILVLLVLFKWLLSKREKRPLGRKKGTLFNLIRWDQPLVAYSCDYIFYSLACSFLAFLIILGPHVGSSMSFAYQLVVPLFFHWLFQKISLNTKLSNVIALVIIFNLYVFGQKTISPDRLRREDPKKWTRLINTVAFSSSILNSPVVTANMVELGLNPIDSGQTIYYYEVKPYQEHTLLGPSYEAFQSNGLQYIQSIDESIKRREFDLVMTTDGEPSFYDENLLNEYYSMDAKMVVTMPQTQETWKIFLWRPVPK